MTYAKHDRLNRGPVHFLIDIGQTNVYMSNQNFIRTIMRERELARIKLKVKIVIEKCRK